MSEAISSLFPNDVPEPDAGVEIQPTADVEPPPEAPDPEPVKAEQPEAPEEKAEDRKVPLAALREERQRRQQLDQELARIREQNARMEERFKALAERFQQPQEPEPKFEEDPAGYLRHKAETTEQRLARLQQEQEASRQSAAQQEAMVRFQQQFMADEAAFAQEAPDYYDAVNHLRETWTKQFQAAGFDPMTTAHMIQNQIIQVSHLAAQRGITPPQAFYQAAKATGFQQQKQAAPANPAANLQRVSNGQRAAAGLGPSGGDGGEMTLAKLAALDDDEFDKVTAGDNWRKLWA